jgi:hypothetical protein
MGWRCSVDTLVWHYTYGPTIERILREGCLMPGELPDDRPDIYKREKAVVWFSANQDWEPTSVKPAQDVATGEIIELTTRTEHQEFWGCYRIGVDPKILKPWMRIQKVARIHPLLVRGLEYVGREAGANPDDWWGTVFPVYFYHWKKVQVLSGDQWEDLRGADGKL